jgi:hypothetical protein
MSLTEAVLSGSRLALSRLLTQIENDTPEGRAALSQLFPHTGESPPDRRHRSAWNWANRPWSMPWRATTASPPRAAAGGGGGSRSLQPIHWRGDHGRPGAHARPGRRPGRIHPLDGLARLAGRAGLCYGRHGAGDGCRRVRRHPDRNRGRRAGGSGNRAPGPHHPGR